MIRKLKNYFHLLEAILAVLWYGNPSRRVTVIGVTGTDGKTTTTSLIYHILKSSGKRVAMVSTVGAYIGDSQYDLGFHVTTPSPFDVQKYIKKAADMGNEYVVLETTSHALDQYRVWGIHYAIGVLTNITHEHLDYHKTYELYVATKQKLLQSSDTCILNKDDESFSRLSHALGERDVVSISIHDESATYTPKKFAFSTSLFGTFNIRNVLSGVACAKTLGLSDDSIRHAIKTFTPPPGRQEIVYNKAFLVMIDFAHTPNAFSVLLPELKKMADKRKGRLIHVFGSAGLRDATKRPLMGKASSESADIIVITAEDPRVEKVADITAAIYSGIPKEKTVHRIEDRKEAIRFAIAQAKKGDVVVITGKSHEKSMNYGDGEVPWDEFEVVKKALET